MADYNLGVAHGSVELDVNTDGVTKAKEELGGVEEQAKRTSKSTDKVSKSTDQSAKKFRVVATTLTVLATKLALVAAAGVGVVAIGMELSGVIGLLPAVGVAGGLAFGTLATGMQGFGDAMKNAGDPEAFAESLKTLTPAARESAIALAEWREDWRDLQGEVQQNLFAGVAPQIQKIAGAYLPMLQSSMARTATGMNGALHSVVNMLMETGRQADIRAILDSSASSVTNLANMARPLVSIFIDLAAVAAPKIQMLTLNLQGATERFAAFISQARESGQLGAWMQTGIQAVRDLWTIMELLGGTVVNLIHALGGPDSFMGVLLLVATALNTVSGFIRENIAWLGPLAAAIGAIVLAVKLWTFATGAWAAASAIASSTVVAALGRVLVQAILLGARFAVLFVQMTVQFAVWVATVIAQTAVIIAQWVLLAAQATLHALRVGAAWLITAGVNATTAVIQTTIAVASILGQWLLMGAQAVARAAVVAGAWLLTTGAAAASAIASMVATAALMVAQWVMMAAGAMARAAIMAAAWFVALGPVGWVIAIIVGLVALIIANWDTVVEWTRKAWNWVTETINTAINGARTIIMSVVNAIMAFWSAQWTAIRTIASTVWNGITTVVQTAINAVRTVVISVLTAIIGFWTGSWNGARATATSIWNSITSTVSSGVNNVLSFVGSLPGRIMGLFSGAFTWLNSAGRNLVTGLWNGIAGGASWLYNKVIGWANGLIDSVLGAFGISSPSKVFAEMGDFLMQGLTIGIDDNASKPIREAIKAAEGINASVGMTLGGSDAFWDATAMGGGRVPASAEVAAYSDAQAAAGATYNFNTYNPVAERASDSEARRLRALNALGAF